MQYVHPEVQMVVQVAGGVTVMGWLPGTVWRPEGGIEVSGDVSVLWRNQARELADALRLVADWISAVADARYGAIAATGERTTSVGEM